jgi:hypothetical protein
MAVLFDHDLVWGMLVQSGFCSVGGGKISGTVHAFSSARPSEMPCRLILNLEVFCVLITPLFGHGTLKTVAKLICAERPAGAPTASLIFSLIYNQLPGSSRVDGSQGYFLFDYHLLPWRY